MHPKNTTGHNRTQYLPSSEGGGQVFAILAIHGAGTGIEIPPLPTKDLEDEAVSLLRQAFPSARLSCVRVAATDDLAELQQQADRHRDIIISCREAAFPGSVYAERLGLHMVFGDPVPQNQPSPKLGAEVAQ